MLGRFALLSLVLLALAACNSRGRPSGPRPDGGPVVMLDGGPRTDAPIVIMFDGGRRDAPTGMCGSGLPACPGGTMCIDGRCVPTTMECTDETVPYNVVAICSASTMTCISGCTTGACIDACLDADPNPDCDACVNQNFISCANDNGCQSAWTTYVCCVDEVCGPMPDSACVMSAIAGACASANAGYDSCLMGVDIGTVCPTFLQDCF